MPGELPLLFSRMSNAIAGLVADAAPRIAAIRTAPNRHITGIAWDSETLLTADQLLPVQDSYTVVLPGGALAPARHGLRDTEANLALLHMDASHSDRSRRLPAPHVGAMPAVGELVLLLTADADAGAAMRLSSVHRVIRRSGAEPAAVILNLPSVHAESGGAVFNSTGRLIGLLNPGRDGATITPSSAMSRLAATARPARQHGAACIEPGASGADSIHRSAPPGEWLDVASGHASRTMAPRRGWLGVALQPIAVPDLLLPQVGQASGRLVVNMTQGGPAEQAGLLVGDVLLALDGHSVTGSHAMRAFLAADRIGRQVEVRLMRDGVIQSRYLTVAEQPAG